MRVGVLCVLLGCLSLCYARPLFSPYLGIDQLQNSEHTTKSKNSILHETGGKYLKLNYESELHDGVLNIDKILHVEEVECKGDYITILVSEYNENFWKSVKVLAGGREWGCLNQHNKPEVILRNVLSFELVAPHTLVLHTEEATYAHAFKTLKVAFSTNLFDTKDPISPSTPAVYEGNHKKERGWFGNFFTAIWNGVTTIGADVTDAVETAWKTIEELAEGSYEGSFDPSVPFHFHIPSVSFHNSAVSCSNCNMTGELSVVFEISLHDYTVDSLVLALKGNVNTLLEGQLTGTEKAWSDSGNQTIATIPVATIPLDIGIPIVLSITVPISIGFSASVAVSASMDAQVSISGDFEFGIEYNNVTSEFDYINQHSWTHVGNFGSLDSEQITADVSVYLMPTFVVEVDKIGGPFVALKTYTEISAGGTANDTQTACTGNTFHAAFNWGLMITLGAKINFWGISKSYSPYTLYSMKLPIESGCVTLNDGAPSFTSGLPAPSDVWYAITNPTCGNFSTLQIATQIVEVSGNTSYAMFSYYGLVDEDMYCTAQALYAINMVGQNAFIADPMTDGDGFALGCDHGVSTTFVVHAAYGKYSSDYDTIYLVTDDNCINAQLTRT